MQFVKINRKLVFVSWRSWVPQKWVSNSTWETMERYRRLWFFWPRCIFFWSYFIWNIRVAPSNNCLLYKPEDQCSLNQNLNQTRPLCFFDQTVCSCCEIKVNTEVLIFERFHEDRTDCRFISVLQAFKHGTSFWIIWDMLQNQLNKQNEI